MSTDFTPRYGLEFGPPSSAPLPIDLATPPVFVPFHRLRGLARRFLRYARFIGIAAGVEAGSRATQEPPMPLYWLHIKSTTAKAGFQRKWFWQRAWDRWWA